MIATYEHSRHTFTTVQGRRAHMCRLCVWTHALWALSHSSLSSHTNVDSARGGKLAKGKSFGQRSLDNRASSYRRASLRRGKDADKEGKEDRKVGRRKWREERGGKSSLCCNRSLPIHVEIIARCGSHRDSKLSGNVCQAVFSAESSFLPP